MTEIATTWLRFDDHQICLSNGVDAHVVIGVGLRDIAGPVIAHVPPTHLEMERAIDVVEKALEASGLRHAVRSDLRIDQPAIQSLIDFPSDGTRYTREDVESRFQQLVAASLSHSDAASNYPVDGDTAAALLILRECMHHLGYEGIRLSMGKGQVRT